MSKTILFPTDFTIQSLKAVKTVLQNENTDEPYHILLLHGFELSDAISDLLFFSASKQINQLKGNEFDEACNILKNKFDSKISSISIDLFTGYNQRSFNNYVAAKNIFKAYVPAKSSLNKVNKKSFDVVPFIRKSNLKVVELAKLNNATTQTITNDSLAELFVNDLAAG